jgi:LAS superfamily LD-carboxypeptidase LdcB
MSFYTDVIQPDPRFHSPVECRDVALLEHFTRIAVANIIADAKSLGISLIVTETFRSAERQEMLFSQRATQLRTVGTHHYGLACDFAKIIMGAASWAGDWQFLADLAAKHGLVSGLNWNLPGPHGFVDPDHVQRCEVAQQELLFAGEWYPSA